MWGVRSSLSTGVVAILVAVVVSCAEDNATDSPYTFADSGAGGAATPASGGSVARGSGGTSSPSTSGGAPQSGGAVQTGGAPQNGGASSATGGASSADASAGGVPSGDASVSAGGVSQTGGAPSSGGAPDSGGASGTGGAPTGGTSNTGGAVTGGRSNAGGAPTGGASNTGGAATGGRSNTGGAPTGGAPSTGGAPTGGASNTGGAPTGGVSNTGGAPTGGAAGSGGTGGSPTCLSQPLMTKLGKSSVLVGASMSDSSATAAPFDMRYLYLAGGIFDGTSACSSCATGCTAKGVSCANSGPGCAWWGCWQWDQDPPGAYARGFFSTAVTNNQFPMITYYEVLQASGASEGAAEVAATNNVAFMQRYLSDWRFVIGQVAGRRVFLHIEPDFWGFAEQVNQNPHSIPAAVASAHSECTGFENSIAGLGRCMIDMVRRHAPTALVGLHASGWATKIDVLQNRSASLDVVGEANKLGTFLSECGAGDGDFVVVDPSDRDAAWYESQGQDRWWDETNATLPNFTQAFTWAKALAERVGRPIVWWQVPVGNMSQNNTNQHWRDNRVDYFFAHMDQVAASHGVAVLFGAGDGNQTTPETDGGNLIGRVNAYAGARTPACP